MVSYIYQILLIMNESLKADIKGQKSKLTKESIREEIYSKLFNGIDYLLDNECYLPKSITVTELRFKGIERYFDIENDEKVDLRLNENERKKLKNIVWYISHSKLWSEL